LAPDPGKLEIREFSDISPIEKDLASGRSIQGSDKTEECGFPRTGGAIKDHVLIFIDLKANVLDGPDFIGPSYIVPFRQIFSPQDGLHFYLISSAGDRWAFLQADKRPPERVIQRARARPSRPCNGRYLEGMSTSGTRPTSATKNWAIRIPFSPLVRAIDRRIAEERAVKLIARHSSPIFPSIS